MLVEYDVIHVPKRSEDVCDHAKTVYRGMWPKEFCCQSMRAAYGSAVKFGSFNDYTKNKVDVMMGVLWHCDEGTQFDDYAICFCPFCGEAITTKENAQYDRVFHKKMETTEKTYTEDIVREEG